MSRHNAGLRRLAKSLCLAALFLKVICFAGASFAEEVKHVIDGDTLVLTSEIRVRLIGIDTPEVDHPEYGQRGEPFGDEATEYLKKPIAGQPIRLEYGAEPKDRYGRTLAYVFLPDGTFVNREMVRAGYAETFRRFDFAYKQEFLKLEKEAQKANLGMWRDEEPDDWKKQFQHWLSTTNKRKAKVSLTDK